MNYRDIRCWWRVSKYAGRCIVRTSINRMVRHLPDSVTVQPLYSSSKVSSLKISSITLGCKNWTGSRGLTIELFKRPVAHPQWARLIELRNNADYFGWLVDRMQVYTKTYCVFLWTKKRKKGDHKEMINTLDFSIIVVVVLHIVVIIIIIKNNDNDNNINNNNSYQYYVFTIFF